MWQGFAFGGAARVARPEKVPTCQTQPVPTGSKKDSPLVSDVGSTTGLRFPGRAKKHFTRAPERVIICVRNSSAHIMVSDVGSGRCAPGPGIEICLQPMVKTIVMQVVPLHPL